MSAGEIERHLCISLPPFPHTFVRILRSATPAIPNIDAGLSAVSRIGDSESPFRDCRREPRKHRHKGIPRDVDHIQGGATNHSFSHSDYSLSLLYKMPLGHEARFLCHSRMDVRRLSSHG